MVDAFDEIKQLDSDTALTRRYIRTMVEQRKITVIKYGYAWIINMDELFSYFTSSGVQCSNNDNFWENELGLLIEEHPMLTSKKICQLFYDYDKHSLLRPPNLRRFVQENNVLYFPITQSKWLINIVDLNKKLNPRRINQKQSLPRIRGQIKAFEMILEQYPQFVKQKDCLRKVFNSPTVFKIKNGGHWLVNYDEFETAFKEEYLL